MGCGHGGWVVGRGGFMLCWYGAGGEVRMDGALNRSVDVFFWGGG